MRTEGPQSALARVVETTYLVAAFRDRALLLAGVGPVCGEDLVGLPAEEQVERRGHEFGHNLAHEVVPVTDRPAAVLEPPASSSPGPPGACMTPSRTETC